MNQVLLCVLGVAFVTAAVRTWSEDVSLFLSFLLELFLPETSRLGLPALEAWRPGCETPQAPGRAPC